MPAVKSITVALPGGGPSPIVLADKSGYFKSAGIGNVEISDIEEPLLGLLRGELDFAVIDQLDAVDGAMQGLPLVAIAGHRNYAADGEYGGDLIAVSQDFLDQNGATVSAFLTAYVRALRDIEDSTDVPVFGPFDGGFGDRAEGSGLAELSALATDELGSDADVGAVVDPTAVQRAQTWWGIPANPAINPAGADNEEE